MITLCPPAVRDALLAPQATAFGAALQPVTLAHVAALAALGVRRDLATPEDAFVAAALLRDSGAAIATSHAPNSPQAVAEFRQSAAALMLRTAHSLGASQTSHELAKVREHLAAAFAPMVSTKRQSAAPDLKRAGFVAEAVEFLMGEYRMPFATAFYETPLPLLFVLMAANAQRNGAEFGAPTYVEQAVLAERAASRA